MSQYQPNAAPNRSFIEKINSKFSNLSVSGSLSSGPEHDGSSEDLTLIHKAFVKFFDQNNESYPEWLGAKRQHPNRQHSEGYIDPHSYNSRSSFGDHGDYSNSQFQPVRASYNSRNVADIRDQDGGDVTRISSLPAPVALGGYTRRTNSRLQEMYNKSRQKLLIDTSQSMMLGGGSSATRTNSTTSQMRRDRVLNGMSQSGDSRATWGR